MYFPIFDDANEWDSEAQRVQTGHTQLKSKQTHTEKLIIYGISKQSWGFTVIKKHIFKSTVMCRGRKIFGASKEGNLLYSQRIHCLTIMRHNNKRSWKRSREFIMRESYAVSHTF